MKKLIKYTVLLYLLFVMPNVKAQVLFSEDFDSYPAGHLNATYNGTTLGQGGWLTWKDLNSPATAMVTPETGKGNVVTLSSSQGNDAVALYQKDIVKNIVAGNNILKLEYEFYIKSGTGNVISYLMDHYNLLGGTGSVMYMYFRQKTNQIMVYYPIQIRGLLNIPSHMYNTWVKVEMIIDYNNNYLYYYVPLLNINIGFLASANIRDINDIVFTGSELDSLSVVKLDNIKLSALQTLPPYILSTNEQLAAKFNLYPNPATNVVNITNSESMLVQQITVYDVTGKLVSTQNFNNETEIQLNVENLGSGIYMLHLQTEQGIAVKKLVKK